MPARRRSVTATAPPTVALAWCGRGRRHVHPGPRRRGQVPEERPVRRPLLVEVGLEPPPLRTPDPAVDQVQVGAAGMMAPPGRQGVVLGRHRVPVGDIGGVGHRPEATERRSLGLPPPPAKRAHVVDITEGDQETGPASAAPASRGPVLVTAAATLAALVLGLHRLGRLSFWYDELQTVGTVDRPFGDALWRITHWEVNQSPFYLLVAGWIRLGDSEAFLRLLSVAAWVGTVPLLFLLGRRLVDPRVGARGGRPVRPPRLHAGVGPAAPGLRPRDLPRDPGHPAPGPAARGAHHPTGAGLRPRGRPGGLHAVLRPAGDRGARRHRGARPPPRP